MYSKPIEQIGAHSWTNYDYTMVTFGALAVQLWELANAFFDEVDYIWRSRFTFVKSLYIWSRYVPLAAQIAGLVVNFKTQEVPMRTRLCVQTIIFRTLLAQQSMSCLDMILLVRVYALYNQSPRVKYFLCTAFLTAFTVETSSHVRVITTLLNGNPCSPENLPTSALLTFCVAVSCFQVLIIFMTLFKYVTGHYYGWARTPLTSLLLRECLAVSFLMFSLLIVNLAVYLTSPTIVFESGIANFSWYISLLSVSGCRLILGLRKLAVSHTARGSDDDYEVEFTSNLNIASSES